jgi:hypothetical protein
VKDLSELAGHTLAVRSTGRPYTIMLRLRKLGLEGRMQTTIVEDKEVGRWCQWKKVVSGECIGTFMSPLYIQPALDAGLKILPVAEVDLIGHYAQGCLTSWARENDDLLRQYMRAVIHAICLLKLRTDDAMEIVTQEPMGRMRLTDLGEMRRQLDTIVEGLQCKPYPTPEAIATTYESATLEYRGADGLNPLAVWDLHWVKQLDDEGFIDDRIREMQG